MFPFTLVEPVHRFNQCKRLIQMGSKYALDIDTPEDWMVAEMKMKQLQE